jgi:hypothetical protein
VVPAQALKRVVEDGRIVATFDALLQSEKIFRFLTQDADQVGSGDEFERFARFHASASRK